MNEHGRLDRYTSKLGHQFTLLVVFIGERIARRGMDNKLGCTVRVPQREKRKCFRNFATYGAWELGSPSPSHDLPFGKEPAREHDARPDIPRGEPATVVRTLRKGC